MRIDQGAATFVVAAFLFACSAEQSPVVGDGTASVLLDLGTSNFVGTSVRVTGQRVSPSDLTTPLAPDSKYRCNSTLNACLNLGSTATGTIDTLCPSQDVPRGVWTFNYQIFADAGCVGAVLNGDGGTPFICYDSHDIFSRNHPNQTVGEPLDAGVNVDAIACQKTICRDNSVGLSIDSNFNGTPIDAGTFIWFSSVFNPPNFTSVTHVYFRNAQVTFSANATNYTIPLPDAVVTLDPSLTTATTELSGNLWDTNVPTALSGNVFLTGVAWPVPVALPGGINPVTMTASVTSDATFTFAWQWAAAVYTQFPDAAAPVVKAVDDNHYPPFKNSDHAGTPENDTAFVIGGARGGGGGDFTGSYSATQSVSVTRCPPDP